MLPQVKVLRPEGMLDASKSTQFRQQIKDIINEGARYILIDLKKVNFIDSSGLGALVLALKMVKEKGGKLFLMSLNEQVKMLFELTNTGHLFEVINDEAELAEKIKA
ncbi:MAG: STAS domain-containing protein [Geminocystis sp.]|nr:STAS domain-containing protein [Geminocystis sp.]HIK36859.1 STAS domain-containing protein [Geminocystis sp. M7585_C2015_104]MCS7148029.1 STAS domain-containing protein [Geminocystis sp.]MCX8077773.1 STAS domain-containing protein [Geminocystis sp.]MDW8116381.1 STAS domain-containing protein [Geminocystis sp.]